VTGRGRRPRTRAVTPAPARFFVGWCLLPDPDFSFPPVAPAPDIVDGIAMIEGDIALGLRRDVPQRSEMRRNELAGGPVARAAATTGARFRWPDCTVPFRMNERGQAVAPIQLGGSEGVAWMQPSLGASRAEGSFPLCRPDFAHATVTPCSVDGRRP
jgi:hypothetical protein